VRTQGIGSVKTQPRLASLRWFGLGFMLVLGIAVIMLGLMLWMPMGKGAGGAVTTSEDVTQALQLQRFGEWQYYEAPLVAPSEVWQDYRAGERAPR
jgi:hypothetical protein